MQEIILIYMVNNLSNYPDDLSNVMLRNVTNIFLSNYNNFNILSSWYINFILFIFI